MADARGRRHTPPAGNWPPYVQACLRKGLWFRAAALAISSLGTAFFATALWLGCRGHNLLGVQPAQAGLALLGQSAASVFLALDLFAARREHHAP